MNLVVYAAAMALVSTPPPENTCITGELAPRVTSADLAKAEAVVGVRIESVERLPYASCRISALAETVDGSTRFAVGQAIVLETRCADANTMLEHADAWLYSDVPVVGEQGRFYFMPYNFTPPGSHYIALRNQAALADVQPVGSGSAKGCSG